MHAIIVDQHNDVELIVVGTILLIYTHAWSTLAMLLGHIFCIYTTSGSGKQHSYPNNIYEPFQFQRQLLKMFELM